MSPSSERFSDDEPVVVAAADDAFVMPLAVMIRSVLVNSTSARHIHLFVIDAGISDSNKKKLQQSWDLTSASLHWITPAATRLGQLSGYGHISSTTYYRVLLPELLPLDVNKAIYLDSDLVVQRDISDLWAIDTDDVHLLAVQDMTAPYMSAADVLSNFEEAAPYLSAEEPLPTYQTLGIPPQNPYFNGGVLVLNLRKWRQDNTSRDVFGYLQEHSSSLRWWDQDGLNAILYDKWKPLDLRWNQIPHIYRYPSWRESPYDEATYNDIISTPYIIHYATASKPWHRDCTHPAKDVFLGYLQGTQWSAAMLKASWMVQRAGQFLRIRK